MSTDPSTTKGKPSTRDTTGDTGSSDGISATVQTNDIRTYYERRGEGPPVVFIHGMFMSTTEWEPQMDALSDTYSTIAYDVRGHGHTGGSDLQTYTFEQYASDLHELLDALDVERPVLCGLSMGGCIAQAYAARYPENVAGLVLADTFTAGPLPLKARLVFRNLRFLGRLDRVVRYPTINRIQLWVGNKLSPGVASDAEAIQRLVADAPTIPHSEVRKIADCMSRLPESGLDISTVTVPTHILYGEHTPAAFKSMHRRLALEMPEAPVTTTVVPDAGHASNIDNPEFFTNTVRAFLADVCAD